MEQKQDEESLEITTSIESMSDRLKSEKIWRITCVDTLQSEIILDRIFPPVFSYYSKDEALDLLKMARAVYGMDLYDYNNGLMKGD
jgi:hypothetical protein